VSELRDSAPRNIGLSSAAHIGPHCSVRPHCLVEIRALRPADRNGLIAAVERSRPRSLYRRFFGAKSKFSEAEVAFFLNIDFVNHGALVAVVEEGGRAVIVGGGRYIVSGPEGPRSRLP
jgi:hypothetical protein